MWRRTEKGDEIICELTSLKLFSLPPFHLKNICCKCKDLTSAPEELAAESSFLKPPEKDRIRISAISISAITVEFRRKRRYLEALRTFQQKKPHT